MGVDAKNQVSTHLRAQGPENMLWQGFRFPRCSTIERLPRKIPSLCELYAIREEPGLVSKLDHTHSLGYRLRLDEQRSWCTLTTVDSKSISSSHEPDRARPESHLERHRRSYPAADFARPERTRRMFHRRGRSACAPRISSSAFRFPNPPFRITWRSSAKRDWWTRRKLACGDGIGGMKPPCAILLER